MPSGLQFPELSPGAHRDLVARLHHMWRRADTPSTRAIATGLAASDVKISHTAVHGLLSGKFPRTPRTLLAVAEWLACQNIDADSSAEENDARVNAEVDEIDALWRAFDAARRAEREERERSSIQGSDPSPAAGVEDAGQPGPHTAVKETGAAEPGPPTPDTSTSPTGAEHADAGPSQKVLAHLATSITVEEFAEALNTMRHRRSVRQIAVQAGVPVGTLSGWFAGSALPRPGSDAFVRVLNVCGVRDPQQLRVWQEAVERIRGVERRSTGARQKPSIDQAGQPIPESPYVGLRAFNARDAGIFFGREQVVQELLGRIRQCLEDTTRQPTVAVVGVSGSGKSSVLQAGLIPQLEDHGISCVTVWPLTLLRDLTDEHDVQVVVIDQFEELWTLAPDEGDRARVLELLSRASEAGQRRVYVLGLRADFYGHAMEAPVLREVLRDPVLIGPMTHHELREVIVRPAQLVGGSVDPGLADLMISEVGDAGSGSLPLLSHALRETWLHSTRNHMSTAAYMEIGRLPGAVERTAEAAFAGLTTVQQELTRQIFLRLVTVDDNLVVRRRVLRSELLEFAHPSSEAEGLIETFVHHRLLTVSEETVEITHESLLSSWVRLASWIDTDRAWLTLRRQITTAAQLWIEHGRPDDYLFAPRRLDTIYEWMSDADHHRELTTVEHEFLQRGQTLARRRSQRQRLMTILLAMLLVIALLASVSVLSQRNDARAQAALAAANALVAQSASMRASDPALAQQLALAAYRTAPTIETRSALLDSSAIPTPERIPTVPGPAVLTSSPDATLLAVGNADGQVRLIDRTRRDQTPVSAVFTDSSRLYAVAFRPDGRMLAAGGDSGVSLWDLSQPGHPRLITKLPGLAGKADDLAWAPDGTELAAASVGGTLRWTIAADAAPTPLPVLPSRDSTGHEAAVLAVAYSPSGSLLATGGANATVQLWDRRAPATPTALIEQPAQADVLDLAFDATSTRLAVGTRSVSAVVFDVTRPATPVAVRTAGGFASHVNAVAFTPDNTTLIAGSSDNTVRLFDLNAAADAPARQTLPGPAIITSIVATQDRVITASIDGVVREWPISGPMSADLGGTIYQLATDKANHVAVAGQNLSTGLDVVHQFDISNPAAIHERGPALTFDAGDEMSEVVAITDDGRIAAVGTKNGSIYTWDIGDPTSPRRIAAPITATSGSVAAAVFTPDARYLLAAGTDDTRIVVIDRTDPTEPIVAGVIDAGDFVQLLSVSDDGRYLAAGTSSGAQLWDISADPTHARPTINIAGFGEGTTSIVRFGSDHLLAVGDTTTVRLFTVTDTQVTERAVIDHRGAQIQSLTFDPTSTRLAAVIGDGEIRVWNVDSPQKPFLTAVLTAYQGRVNDVVFSPDKNAITAAGTGGTLRTWQLDPDNLARTICTHPESGLTKEERRRYLPALVPSTVC